MVVAETDQLRVKVHGVLSGALGRDLEQTVEVALMLASSIALDLRDVSGWTPDGLASLDRIVDRGVALG